jgi:hypothetical protein
MATLTLFFKETEDDLLSSLFSEIYTTMCNNDYSVWLVTPHISKVIQVKLLLHEEFKIIINTSLNYEGHQYLRGL